MDSHTPLPNRRRSILASTASTVSSASLSTDDAFLSPASSSRKSLQPVGDGSPGSKELRRSRKSGNILSAVQSPTIESRQIQKPQMSEVEVLDHYENCIKLISQNKVSAKNAFGLHLIDVMDRVLNTGSHDAFFQMAGCTVHAGAKIYEYRVDGLHSDTYKVANVLSNRSENVDVDNANDNREENDEFEDALPNELRRKKRQKNFKCIVKDINKIIKPIKYNIDHDALRQKAANLLDASKSSELLTINLPKIERDRKEKIVIDGVEPVSYDRKRLDAEEIPNIATSALNLPPLDALKHRMLCPDLETLLSEENNVSIGSVVRDLENTRMDKFLLDCDQNLAFDADAPVAEQEGPVFDHLGGFDGAGDDGPDILVMAPHEPSFPGDVSAISNAMYGGEFDLGGSSNFDMLQDSLENLLKHVQPGEYSYFSESVLSALRPKISAKQAAALDTGRHLKRKTKQTAESIKVDYENKFVVKSCKSRAATTLTDVKADVKKKTCVSFDRKQYTRSMLTSYFELDILKSISNSSKNPEEVRLEEEYNYENNNDVNNFCHSAYGRPDDYIGDDPGDDMGEFAQDIDDGENEFDRIDNLVDAPLCPEQHKIGYAKRAKNVDVRKVKRSMFKHLVDRKVDQNSPTLTELFSNAHSSLPSKVVRDLSIQVAFATLLDLTNEQKLTLTQPVHGLDFSVHLPSDHHEQTSDDS